MDSPVRGVKGGLNDVVSGKRLGRGPQKGAGPPFTAAMRRVQRSRRKGVCLVKQHKRNRTDDRRRGLQQNAQSTAFPVVMLAIVRREMVERRRYVQAQQEQRHPLGASEPYVGMSPHKHHSLLLYYGSFTVVSAIPVLGVAQRFADSVSWRARKCWTRPKLLGG